MEPGILHQYKRKGNTSVSNHSHDSILPPKWVLFALVITLFGWLIWELKEIASLLVVAYCIAYLIDPIVSKLERKRIPRTVGIIITFLCLGIICVFLVSSAIPTLVRDYDKFSDNLPAYAERVNQFVSPYIVKAQALLEQHTENGGELPGAGAFNLSSAKNLLSGIGGALLKGYSLTLTILNLVLLPFFVFYLALDFHPFHRRMLEFLPLRLRSEASSIAREIDGYVSSFVRGQLLVGLTLTILYALGLGIVGLDLWFLLACISGFGNIVPYLGFILGITLSTVIAIFSFGDFDHVLFVWLVFVIVQVLEGILVTPKIIGDKVGLSPLAIIIAVVAGGQIFGFLGIVLAVPLAASLRVLVSRGRRWFFSEEGTSIPV